MITHPPPAMDEFLDQMFSLPSWNDIGGNAGRASAPWDFNGAAAAATRMGVDPQKLFTMSLLPQDGAHVGDGGLHPNDDNLLGDRLRGLQVNSAVAGLVSRGATLTRSPSEGSNCSEGSGGPQSPPPVAPTWKQPYVGGVPPLPLGLGQAKPEPLLRGDNSDAHLGKRAGDDDDVSMREGSDPLREVAQGLFASFTGAQLAQSSQLPRQGGHSSLQQQGNDSPQGQVYGAQGVNVQAQTGGAAAISARPRVRARRGQATDPHSIAERLRRERIAERMKALQDLVPNSNKTDKASMLDEIIDYVKFLQLQVKVLSMSRLGGAGAVAPLVADLPAEVTASMGRANGVGVAGPSQDGMALTDRQVARLMEKDMGSAMQYLQSKGLCLMPISLATAISGTNSRSQTGNGVTDRQRSEATGAAVALNHGGSSSGTAPGDGDAANTSGSGLAKNVNDGRGDGVEKSTEDSYTDFYKTGEHSTTSSHMGAVSTPSSYTDFDKSDVL